jgi:hypothetical protein
MRNLPGARRLAGAVLASLSTLGALALSAPAAQAVTNTTLTFGAGTVQIEDQGPAFDTVRFTMRVANPATTRVFVDTHATGRGYIALGSPTALGVAHAVYNDVSTESCQVYTGRTFGEADEVPTGDPNAIAFDIRKDELAPQIAIAMEDSAGGAADCVGFDGVSAGRPLSFATAGQAAPALDWQQPGDATGLAAIPGPHAITLVWTPPADALGVRYEVYADGSPAPLTQAAGSAVTIQDLVPGVPHSFRLRAFRFWGGQWFSPGFTATVTAAATEFPPPSAPGAAAGAGAGAGTGAAAAAGSAARGAVADRQSTRRAARPATPRAARARVSRGRVTLTLHAVAKGRRIRIERATGAKGKFATRATTTRRTFVDRTVRRGRTYRYRLVVLAGTARSLPSTAVTVRVPRR